MAGYYKKLQAETPSLKSTQSIYPTYDRSSPSTEPYDAYNIRRNTIGDGNWSDPGSWVSYEIEDVPADGLYYITLKYRQHQMLGSSTFRTLRVNGAVPGEAYENVAFPYNVNWQNKTISGEDGKAMPVFLQEGRNEIRLEATMGKWAEVLRKVEASTQRLNDMCVQMVMITGTTPDKYFDYDLETEIPDLISCFTSERKVMLEMADEFDRLNGQMYKEAGIYWQYCYSNDGLIAEVAKRIIQKFDADPNKYIYSLTPNDGWNFKTCNCDKCNTFANDSEVIIYFANAVGEIVGKKYPDRIVSFLSYHATLAVPTKNMKLRDNVEIMFCAETTMTKPIQEASYIGMANSKKNIAWAKNCKDDVDKTRPQNIAIWKWLCIAAESAPWENIPWVQGNVAIQDQNYWKSVGADYVFYDQGPSGAYREYEMSFPPALAAMVCGQ